MPPRFNLDLNSTPVPETATAASSIGAFVTVLYEDKSGTTESLMGEKACQGNLLYMLYQSCCLFSTGIYKSQAALDVINMGTQTYPINNTI